MTEDEFEELQIQIQNVTSHLDLLKKRSREYVYKKEAEMVRKFKKKTNKMLTKNNIEE